MRADSQLVEKAKRGDRGAYEELVRRHQDRVFHFTLYMLPSWQDAEDVAQEAFIEAYRSLGRFRGEASFGTWVLSIARVQVARWYRRRRPEEPTPEIPETPSREIQPLPPAHLEIRQAVAQLPEAYREIVVMKYANELDMQEIADATGLSLTAVGVRLHRARAMLRKLLSAARREEECCGEM